MLASTVYLFKRFPQRFKYKISAHHSIFASVLLAIYISFFRNSNKCIRISFAVGGKILNFIRPSAQAVTLALGDSRPKGDANPQRRPPLLLKAKGLKYSSCKIHKISRYTVDLHNSLNRWV